MPAETPETVVSGLDRISGRHRKSPPGPWLQSARSAAVTVSAPGRYPPVARMLDRVEDRIAAPPHGVPGREIRGGYNKYRGAFRTLTFLF